MSVLLLVCVLGLPSLVACGLLEDKEDRPEVSEVVGLWRGGGERTVEFHASGEVELGNVRCKEVLASAGSGMANKVGEWEVGQDRTGAEVILLEFPKGFCDSRGSMERVFYYYRKSGELYLHLTNPDMHDKNLTFRRVSVHADGDSDQ
ncbi:hypothetical protein [Streptomyces alkaliterrae]|uniref:Lipoprotein n=1 Tax=Streptomyces alkaliterrae TaxID=2213162 RepID=A0A5P0YMT2_9ACTN|nr:hypothetical protein [Streptomyces alkaliterrae]MBB1254033.1 hypothetical protein [Streptomyces alkaliterrae]MBB1260572.1 hypothetical protein [Streptomyces alkaliterrae]MQS01571.1 hypothetical protein [Streptomyces alkaliterrae]